MSNMRAIRKIFFFFYENISLRKKISFYKDTPDNETISYDIINGSDFRVYAGHCNSGNGEINILTCYAI